MQTTTAARNSRLNLWALKPNGSAASGWLQRGSSTIAESLPASSPCDYWKRRFAGMDLELRLPFCTSEDRLDGTAVITPTVEISGSAAERVRALARSELTTPFTLLLAAWQVVLFRHGGRSDFVVGCGMPGSVSLVQEKPLLVHATVNGHSGFRALLRTVSMRRAEGATHGNITLPNLVRTFADDTPPDRHPVFQAAFVQRNSLRDDVAYTTDNRHAPPVDLACIWDDNGQTIRIRVEYPAGVMAPDVAARLPVHMANILRAAIALPEAPISTLPMLTASEYLEKTRA